MSTHNIGFYEDLTKIIFELSSNIIIRTLFLLLSSATNTVCSLAIIRAGSSIRNGRRSEVPVTKTCAVKFWLLGSLLGR